MHLKCYVVRLLLQLCYWMIWCHHEQCLTALFQVSLDNCNLLLWNCPLIFLQELEVEWGLQRQGLKIYQICVWNLQEHIWKAKIWSPATWWNEKSKISRFILWKAALALFIFHDSVWLVGPWSAWELGEHYPASFEIHPTQSSQSICGILLSHEKAANSSRDRKEKQLTCLAKSAPF